MQCEHEQSASRADVLLLDETVVVSRWERRSSLPTTRQTRGRRPSRAPKFNSRNAGLRGLELDDLSSTLGAPIERRDLWFDSRHLAVPEGTPALVRPRTADYPSGSWARNAGSADPDQPEVRNTLETNRLASAGSRSPAHHQPDVLDRRQSRRTRARR